MTIAQFNTTFDSTLAYCANNYPNDLLRLKEAYSNLKDAYCKNGLLTEKQYNSMTMSKAMINKFYSLSKATILLNSNNL